MTLRAKAEQCVARARTFLANTDEPSARYSALELRSALELLTYDQVQAYLSELPEDVATKWRVKDMMEELLDADENADRGVGLAVGIESIPGEARTAGLESLGAEYRLRKRETVSFHNALGNFLHPPTLAEMRNGTAATTETMLAKNREVLGELEKVLASPVFNVNIGTTIHFSCSECGSPIARKASSIERDTTVTCRMTTCRAEFDVTTNDAGQSVAHLRFAGDYVCQQCKARNGIPAHRARLGETFRCGCGTESTVVLGLRLSGK